VFCMASPSKSALLHRKLAAAGISRDRYPTLEYDKRDTQINNYYVNYSNFPYCHFKILTGTKEFNQKINTNILLIFVILLTVYHYVSQ
jgi:hypothetical protein